MNWINPSNELPENFMTIIMDFDNNHPDRAVGNLRYSLGKFVDDQWWSISGDVCGKTSNRILSEPPTAWAYVTPSNLWE